MNWYQPYSMIVLISANCATASCSYTKGRRSEMSQILNNQAVMKALLAATIAPSRSSRTQRGREGRPDAVSSGAAGLAPGDSDAGSASRATPPDGVGASDGIGLGTLDEPLFGSRPVGSRRVAPTREHAA